MEASCSGRARLGASSARGRQNEPTNLSTTRRCLVGDKGPGSRGGGKKPKGGPKPGDKKKS